MGKVKTPAPLLSLGFPCSSAGKESSCNAGDLGSIPGLVRSPGEGKGYLLENSMDCIIHRVAKSRTQLSNFHFLQSLPSGVPMLTSWATTTQEFFVLRQTCITSYKFISLFLFFLCLSLKKIEVILFFVTCFYQLIIHLGCFPGGSDGRESACQCRRGYLGGEDPLEEEMATHSSILAWEIPQKSLAGCNPWGPIESDCTEHTHSWFTILC